MATDSFTADPNSDEEVVEEGGIRIGDIYIPPPPPPACTFDPTGPRLIITHIVNEFFKSYAGKQTLGPFHKNFTCIIGPNGSGKSNVIDSMLFVFGYRAQKIRSKKISVLIHNSQQHPNVESCTVAVHFQKVIEKSNDEFEVVPNSQFVVARTAFKDNSSWYSINGKRCQFKEVAKLLRFHGIDLDHNRFLILQGEVEMIAMMKPKALTENETGMLEYLEDIIGSNRFEKPIEMLSKRIDELNEERGEKLNRVKIVEKEKDGLEGPKNEAVEYLTLENSIVKKKNILYQYYLYENRKLQEESEEKKKEIEEGMSGLLESLKEVQKKRKEQDKEHKSTVSKYETACKTIDERKAQFSEFEQQDIRCREDIKHAKTKAKKLQQSLENETKQLSELQKVPSKNEAEIVELKSKRETLEVKKKKEEDQLAQVMASLKTETKSFQEEKDLLEKKLVDLKEKEDDTKSKMHIANSEIEIYMSNEVKEKTRLEELQKNYNEAKKSLDEKEASIKDMEKQIPLLEKTFKETKSQLNKVEQDSSHIIDELRSKRLRVEEARSAMNASRSQSKVLNALMQQKANGNIPGILGRLGDLGAIDEKYDIAISTACGPLDNIVTDTIDTAQKCVNFLKRSNIGIATFIGLDKMEKWKQYMHQRLQTPENVPRLFDLVQVNDERILPAFYFALRDTLVADNLDQATRIAFHGSSRYRVVSLQGHLIDQSGTMSGGGNQVSKGRMGSKLISVEFTPNQINDMVEEVDALTSKSSDLNRLKNDLDVQAEQQSRQLEQTKTAIQKYKREVEVLIQQVSTFNERIKDQEARVKAAAPDKNKVKSLTAAATALKADYEKAAKAASEIDMEVQRLHKKIMDITNSKMKHAQQKLDEVNKKIDLIDGAITKANVAIKTANRNMKKSETKIKNMESEKQENSNKVTKMHEELSELEGKAKKVMDEMEATLASKNQLEAELAEIKTLLGELQTKENQLNKEKLNCDHDLEKWVGKIADCKNKKTHWTKEKNKLSLHAIEGQEQEELKEIEEEELQELDPKKLQYDSHVEQENLGNMKPNMAAIAEFKRKEQQYLQRVGELNAVTEQRDSQRKSYEDLRKQRLNEFMKGFSIITNKLKEMYQMITLGGDAELELKDSTDPFSEGIVFSVRPPKKSWKEISNLSGGEKTLSSLALVFALHFYKPTPLYVMDEIDAALDFKNVSIIAHYIKEKTKNAQFVIISLRNHMFELADRLVGIYKTYNCTKSVTVNPHIFKSIEPNKDQTSEGQCA